MGSAARRVATAWLKQSAESFEEWIEGERFPSPKTGKPILFKSLPKPERDKIRARWPGGGTEEDATGAQPGKVKDPLFHTTSHAYLEEIAEKGLVPRSGGGTWNHGGYAEHSQGKVFLSDQPDAARSWQGKVFQQLENQHGDDTENVGRRVPVMLRVKSRETEVDPVGDKDVPGSRITQDAVPPEDIEFWHPKKKQWAPISAWEDTSADEAISERSEDGVYINDGAFMPGDDDAYERDDATARREEEARRQEKAEKGRRQQKQKAEKQEAEKKKQDMAKWLEPETRQKRIDKIKSDGAKAPFPMGKDWDTPGVFPKMWQEKLKVDREGNPHPDHPFKTAAFGMSRVAPPFTEHPNEIPDRVWEDLRRRLSANVKKVAASWIRYKLAAQYSPEFYSTRGLKRYHNPETGNKVLFYNLPQKDKDRMYAEWERDQAPHKTPMSPKQHGQLKTDIRQEDRFGPPSPSAAGLAARRERALAREKARKEKAKKVASLWFRSPNNLLRNPLSDYPLKKKAKYNPKFLEWVEQQRFVQTGTRNRVLFESLEDEKQKKKIYENWARMTQGEDAERRKEENRYLGPNPNPKRYDHIDFGINLGDDEEEEQATKKLLSDMFETEDQGELRNQILDLAGAGGNAELVESATVRVYGEEHEVTIKVSGRGEHGLNFDRTIVFEETGDDERPWMGSRIVNDNFSVGRQAPPGMATRMLASQVGTASDAGFSSIETEASGAPDQMMNGYYTWPRLGFNAELSQGNLEDLEEHDPEAAWEVQALAEADEDRMWPDAPAEIFHVMAVPAAREWWEKEGHRLMASFSVSEDFDGGKAYQLLRAYTEAKAMAEGKTIPEYLSKIGAEKPKNSDKDSAPRFTDQDNKILDRVWEDARKRIKGNVKKKQASGLARFWLWTKIVKSTRDL